MRTRHICNLPLLQQVQKLKKQCNAYTLLTTNTIFRVTNFGSHFLTAACADFKVILNHGILTLFFREIRFYQFFLYAAKWPEYSIKKSAHAAVKKYEQKFMTRKMLLVVSGV